MYYKERVSKKWEKKHVISKEVQEIIIRHPLRFNNFICVETSSFWKIITFSCVHFCSQSQLKVAFLKHAILLSWSENPSGPRLPHCWGFEITFRHGTLARTPLDEWSARRIDFFLTSNTQKREASMALAEFEHAIPATERPLKTPWQQSDYKVIFSCPTNHTFLSTKMRSE